MTCLNRNVFSSRQNRDSVSGGRLFHNRAPNDFFQQQSELSFIISQSVQHTFVGLFYTGSVHARQVRTSSQRLFSDVSFVIFQPANILLDENGHVRISDLGLACDFSKKKPHASV